MKANKKQEKQPKTKEEKLLGLRFWFESNSKKYVDFREDKVYKAILEAIDRLNYQDFLPIDIIQDITKYNPEVIEELRNKLDKSFVERSIGSRLKQLKERSLLEKKGEKPSVRQQVFGIVSDVENEVKKYIKTYLNEQ